MKHVIFGLILAVSSAAFAKGPGQVGSVDTKVESDLRCGEKWGIAVALPDLANGKDAKIWLLENKSDKQGVELTVLKTSALRCKNCFNIEAETEIMDQKVKYVIELRTHRPPFLPDVTIAVNGELREKQLACQ